MKKSKNIAITEALSEGTIVSTNNISVPAKWSASGNDAKFNFAVLKSNKDCETSETGYITGLHTFINDIPRSLAKARDKDNNVTSWEDVDEGTVVAICHNNYYRIFSSKKLRDAVLQYCIMKQYFESKCYPSTYPNIEAAIGSFMLSEGIKPTTIIKAMKHVNGKTEKECRRYIKNYKPAADVSMAGVVDDDDSSTNEPKADSTPAADPAAQSA